MFLAENLKKSLSTSIAHDLSKALGLSPNPYTTERDNKSVCSRNVISFSVLRYVCRQTRYTRFARAIYCSFAPMRYDINPLTPRRAYHLPQANITPEGNITNPRRDLYRCVFSAKDNTPTPSVFLFFIRIKSKFGGKIKIKFRMSLKNY